jgi:hypothetical protein
VEEHQAPGSCNLKISWLTALTTSNGSFCKAAAQPKAGTSSVTSLLKQNARKNAPSGTNEC